MDLPAELEPVLLQQRGLLTRAQLRRHGVSPAAVRWRLQRTWRLVLPGVVATFTGALDGHQRLVAAQLYAGESGVIGSCTAAAWHGVESARSPLIHVTVPESRSARRAGFVVVSRSARPDVSTWSRPPLVIASRARAVVDAARDVGSHRAATALIIEAVQRRLVTLPALRHELEAGQRRGSRTARLALSAAETGAWSLPEFDLLELMAGSRVLPAAWPNPTLRTADGRTLPTPDAWLDDVGLAVQVHSRRYHSDELDWDATVMGDTALGEAGIMVLPVTPNRIAREPGAVLARVERAHASLIGRPRPDVIAERHAA